MSSSDGGMSPSSQGTQSLNRTLQDPCAPSALLPGQCGGGSSLTCLGVQGLLRARGTQVTDGDRAKVPCWVQTGYRLGGPTVVFEHRRGMVSAWTGRVGLWQRPHWFSSASTRHRLLTLSGALWTTFPDLSLNPGPHQHPFAYSSPHLPWGPSPHPPLKVPSVFFHGIACWAVRS